MSLPPPQGQRSSFLFSLPPAVGAAGREVELGRVLTQRLGKPVSVQIGASYEQLSKDLLAGTIDAAWAPPFVCARVEAMGARILVRGVRKGGASSYRSALVARPEARLSVDKLKGLTAAWIDRDSTAGYLLPMAFFRARGIDPKVAFWKSTFVGSYRAALEKVASGEADLTAIFAPAPVSGRPTDATGIDDVAPELKGKLVPIAFTDETPNDAVAVAMGMSPEVQQRLEDILTSLHESPDPKKLLADVFNVERFEPAPRLGYRALYRVAIAGL